MLAAVRETARTTLTKIDAIQALQRRTRESVRVTSAGANSDLLDVLFEQPNCRIANVIARCGASRPTATKRLNELVDAGVLHRIKVDDRRGGAGA